MTRTTSNVTAMSPINVEVRAADFQLSGHLVHCTDNIPASRYGCNEMANARVSSSLWQMTSCPSFWRTSTQRTWVMFSNMFGTERPISDSQEDDQRSCAGTNLATLQRTDGHSFDVQRFTATDLNASAEILTLAAPKIKCSENEKWQANTYSLIFISESQWEAKVITFSSMVIHRWYSSHDVCGSCKFSRRLVADFWVRGRT